MTVIWPCQHSVRTFGVPPGHGKESYKVVSLMQCTTYTTLSAYWLFTACPQI
jgi:hypothetical protein